MRRPLVLWTAALLVTLLSFAWQRLSGPTYPLRGDARLGDARIDWVLLRSHGGEGDQPVRLTVPDAETSGEVAWRRYPTEDPWRRLALRREGDDLVAHLPHQPPAGKLEYQVRLARGEQEVVFPPQPVVTRFKGAVPPYLLVPHIVLMALAMVFSTRAGFGALVRETRRAWIARTSFVFLVLGGFVLGPAVQKAAFGAWWTGFPYGHDLTDNKVLVAGIVWAWAIWRLRGRREARISVLVAAAVTLVIYAIPHSTWGSEIDWSTVEAPSTPAGP